MKPTNFEHSNKTLQPPSAIIYPTDTVNGVSPLRIWTDETQCVSCWRMSIRERLSALFFGRVWVVVLSGKTQPPICVAAVKEYLKVGNGSQLQ